MRRSWDPERRGIHSEALPFTREMRMSFHTTNYGRFGSALPADTNGYCHTTVREWQLAGYSRDEARELARRAKTEIRIADAALANWRAQN